MLLLLLLFITLVVNTDVEENIPSFDAFVHRYGKQYKDDEYGYRIPWNIII